MALDSGRTLPPGSPEGTSLDRQPSLDDELEKGILYATPTYPQSAYPPLSWCQRVATDGHVCPCPLGYRMTIPALPIDS